MAFLISGFGLLLVGAAGVRPCNLAFGILISSTPKQIQERKESIVSSIGISLWHRWCL